jgi:BirA family biotin operon repressor/biotin-[acetyl-CoA-carboxylase] ligase
MASVVLGIGVNLNQGKADFPKALLGIATSLYRHSGRKLDREKFLQKLLLELEGTYRWLLERRVSKILSEWRKRSVTLGKQVKVTQGRHVFFGQAVEIDEKGALLVRTDSGIMERVVSGDVQMLKIN